MSRQSETTLESKLGHLAMRFRSIQDEEERNKVVAEYERVVEALIKSKEWNEMPSFEDMLPDEKMPAAFYDFWSIPVPHETNQKIARRGKSA